MFFPHLASIEIGREEPSADFDVRRAKEIIRRRNSELAEKIVLKDLLKAPKASKKTDEKLRKMIEFDKRLDSTKRFMEKWNYWRYFYFNLAPIYPKNSVHLTCIENIIDISRENNIDLNLLIATVHRAFLTRKFKPSFQIVIAHGLEFYETFYDDVVCDVEKKEYERESIR